MHTHRGFFTLAVAALLGAAAAQSAPAPASTPSATAAVAARPTLLLRGARRVAAAAVAEAQRRNAPGAAIAVVDAGGNLICLDRLDGTFAMAATVSTGKARTAALFQKPTRVFEEIINKGRTAMTALADFTPLQGGVPIVVGGQLVGAVGVSGAQSAQQDDEIAAIAAATPLDPDATPCCTGVGPGDTTHVPAVEVDAAFAAGRPLLENGEFKVHASRRDGPGRAEVHQGETDVIHVLQGRAAFVTGGTVVRPETTAPGEVRGDAIDGGQEHQLQPGDVFVVPHGVPHWFRAVDGPLLYYVVKVIHDAHGA